MNFVVLGSAALALTFLTGNKESGQIKSSSEIDNIIKTKHSKLPHYSEYAYEVVETKSETTADDEEIEGPDYINPTMEYKGLATDLVNKWFLAQKTNVFHFLRLVVTGFNDGIRSYCLKREIDPERIRFVYKGGNILRIVANEFVLELPGHASDVINDFYNAFFKRTDADFSIYIDPKLPNFEVIHNDLTHLTWMLQRTIREQILADPAKYFDYYRLNSVSQMKMLSEFFAQIQSSDSLKDPTNTTFFGGRFEGVSFEDQHVGVRPMHAKTPDLFIAFDKAQHTVSFSPDDIDQKLRIQVNTALDFGKATDRSSFNLVRIKILFDARFVDVDGNSRTHSFGGELLDVSLPKKADKGLAKFFRTPNVISRYELQQPNELPITFFAYTLQSLIDDLDHILFEFNTHPWDDNKYVKRLNRLFYLCFVDLFVKFGNNEDRKKYMKHWCQQIALRNTNDKFKPHTLPIAFDKFAKRILAADQPVSSTRYVDFKEFIEQIQKNCIVVLTAIKNIGQFCSKSWTLSKQTIYQANLDALIHGE